MVARIIQHLAAASSRVAQALRRPVVATKPAAAPPLAGTLADLERGKPALVLENTLVRPLHAFFLIEIASRRVAHVGVTRHPTDAWVAQQLREATPFGRHPKRLFIDNDCKYGSTFTRIARTTGIELVRTAFRAPKETAICVWFLGSTWRERLDHLLVLGEAHQQRILVEDGAYFNCIPTCWA
jgi:transposase InsO family protein